MFKKKQKIVNKIDLDLVDDTDDIQQVKQPQKVNNIKKIKANQTLSFDRDDDQKADQSFKITSNTNIEYLQEKKVSEESQDYGKEYLDSLKKQNEKISSLNQSLKLNDEFSEDEQIYETSNQMINKQISQSNQDHNKLFTSMEIEEQIQFQQKFQNHQSNQINDDEEFVNDNNELNEDNEDDEEFNQNMVQEAKRKRELSRKRNAGEYIPLNKSFKDEFYFNNEKQRLNMAGIINNQPRQAEISDESQSDDEFNQHHQKLIQGHTNEEQNKIVEEKEFNFDDVENDYFSGQILQRIKKIGIENENRELKLDSLTISIEKSQENIEKQKSSTKTQMESYQYVADSYQYWLELSDMLSEKIEEVIEASNKFQELQMEFSHKMLFQQKLDDLQDALQEIGELSRVKIGFHSQQQNQRINNQNNLRKHEKDLLLKKIQSQSKGNKNVYLQLIALESDDENNISTQYKKDRSDFYDQAQDIFKDVDDEFKQPVKILKQLQDDIQSEKMNQESLLAWYYEAIKPHFILEFFGMDPLGYTSNKFKYFRQKDPSQLELMNELKSFQKQNLENNILNNFCEQTVYDLIEKMGKNLFQGVIQFEWDVFSSKQTEMLQDSLDLYIKFVYLSIKNDELKKQRILEIIKEILTKMIDKIKQNFELLVIPQNIQSDIATIQIWKCLKIMINISKLSNILPLSNIVNLSLSDIFKNLICSKFQLLSEQFQIEILFYLAQNYPIHIMASDIAQNLFQNIQQLAYTIDDNQSLDQYKIQEIKSYFNL